VVGVPPLLVRGEWTTTTLTYGHDPLPPGTPHVITLAPRGQSGAEREVGIGLDRANITAAGGELLAGVLELTDGLGLTRVDLGTSATAASMAGLWVGTAAVTGVSQYLLQYLRDGGGNLVVEQDGSYAVSSITTNVTPVPVPFPLRLILHNPATGPAVLLQRVYVGLNAITNPVIANGEAVLHPGPPHQRRAPAVDRGQRRLGLQRTAGPRRGHPGHRGDALQRPRVQPLPAHLPPGPRHPGRPLPQ
ncbi:MAG TPA: hypothetical protein PKE47_04140, partial [Verrucomicrobiota bacterium]|nr:hypothetical protein [Verrucomicrobiota bacterium]